MSRLSSKSKAAIHLDGEFSRAPTEDAKGVPALPEGQTLAACGLFVGSLQDGEQGTAKLVWRSDQGQAFAQGGLQLRDNAIVIPATGLYFVYSQASFRVSCGDGDQEGAGTGPVPLSHLVWRHSDSVGGRSTLLSAVRSACQLAAPQGGYSQGHGWYNTLYLGAVFQLKAGDKLWTETNQLSQLETDEGKNFFGVFAL